MAPRTYYGWYLVVGLGLTTIVSYGVSQYLFGVLVVPLQQDLGGSRGSISGAFSAGLVLSGLLGIPVGRLVDRFGARLLMSAGSVLGAASLVGLSAITHVWQLYLIWSGCIGLAMALTLYPVTFVVVANWFARRRGAAMALLTVLGGLSSPIFIPISGLLVARLGWRSAVMILAVTTLLIALPIHALFVRRRPEDIGLLPDGVAMPERHDRELIGGESLRAAIRRRAFWTLMVATSLSSFAYSVLLAHLIAYLIGRGYNPVLAAGVLALAGLASLPGRLIFNFLSDRFSPQLLLVLCLALQGLSVVLLMAGTLPFVVAFIAIYGTAFGAVSPLRASVTADHFGRLAYGSITAVQGVPVGIFAGLGPFIAGALFDLFGNYGLAFALTGAAFGLAALAVRVTPAPKLFGRQAAQAQVVR